MLGTTSFLATAIMFLVWCLQLANFLERQFKMCKDRMPKILKEGFLKKVREATVLVVTTVLPLAVLKPLTSLQDLPEPFEDYLLMSTPSVYSDVLMGVLLISLLALPCLCCGACAASAQRRCLSVCTLGTSCALVVSSVILVLRSYWYDGFFFYVDWNFAFSFKATWTIGIMADLVQFLFVFLFVFDLLTYLTTMWTQIRDTIGTKDEGHLSTQQ